MISSKTCYKFLRFYLKPRFIRCIHLNVTPRIALFDEACAITASGIKPNSKATLRLETTDEKGRLFRSHAHFVANSEGNIDLTKDESIGGSYKGLYPMGLFVGLSTLDPKTKHARLHRTNTLLPWNMSISIHEGHTKITDKVDATHKVDVERHLISPGVKRVPIKQGKVRGTLFIPPGSGPHPGTLDIFGGAGGLNENRAALLASRGVASLAVAYFDYDYLPNNLEVVDLDMFIEATDILTSHPEIIPDRCGIWAVCQGAIYGYILADKCDKVRAMVTVNGNIIPFWSRILHKNKFIDLEPFNISLEHVDFDKNLVAWNKLDVIKNKLDPKNKATLNIGSGSLNVSYLLISGSLCSIGGPMICKAFMDKLTAIGNDKVEHISYKDAGHLIEPPYMSLNRYVYNRYWPHKQGGPVVPTTGIFTGMGGTVEGNHAAMEDMWPKTIQFFNKEIKSKSLWYQQLLKDRAINNNSNNN